MKYDIIIINGKAVTPRGIEEKNIYINGDKIVKISEEVFEGERVIDAGGKYIMPGFIDAHVHANDPGLTNSEDYYTATCAAAAGGITTIIDHPLTFPLPDNLKDFNDKKEIGKSKVVTNFALFAASSPGNAGEVKPIIESGAAAFKAFMTYSPEIPRLDDGQMVERMKLMSNYDIVLAIHCENNDIVNFYTDKMQKEGKTEFRDYPKGRPDIAEIEAVSKMSLFAHHTGCKMNVAHCSLAEAIDIVSGYREKGANITVETCTQYLALDESDLDSQGMLAICNPPLRTKEEVEKLWQRVFEGKIDWVCSDHATYTFEEKEAGNGNAFETPAGTTSLETCFPLFFSEGVSKRGLEIEKFVEMASTNPAKRYRLYPEKGILQEGADADITIFDSEKVWNVKNEDLKQMIKWSPYEGKEVKGKVSMTIVNGKEVYNGKDIIAEKGSGRFVTPISK